MESSLAARMGLLSGGQRPLVYSVLAGLALHALLAWGLGALHAQQPAPTAPQPMQVRLAAEVQSGGPQAVRKVLPAQPADKAQPKSTDKQISAARTTPPADVSRPPAIAPVPPQATPQPQVATAQPRPAPSNEPAQHGSAPVGNLTPPTPAHVNVPAAANAHAAAPAPAPNTTATAQGNSATTRADADAQPAAKGPVDMPSASISYLVQPVLTYPPGSEELGESGSVTLRVLVDEKGVPSKVERLKSSGYPRLDHQAVSVIRRARFVPHQAQGEPRAAWATVTLNFRLN